MQDGKMTEYQEAIDSIIEKLFNVGEIQTKSSVQQDEKSNDDLLKKLF